MNLLNNITNKLAESRRAAGLEAVAGPEGYAFHLVILKKSGSKVLIESRQENIAGVDELKKFLKPGLPVYLALTGRGIVHKKVSAAPSDDARTLLPKVLPNASLKDFYVQSVPGISGQMFVSIVRREALDKLLDELKPAADIVSCALGALPVAGIAALLEKEAYQFEIETGQQRLLFSGGQLSELQPATNGEKQLDVGGEKLSSVLLTAFAAAFGHFSGARVEAEVESLQSQAEEHKQKRLFKTLGGGVLVFFLVLLLGNYFVFQHYWEKKAKLETQLALNGGELQRYQTLEKNLREKRSFLQKSGLLHASKTSYYADRLAQDVPATITLTRLGISPLQRLNTTDSIAFTPGLIVVEGGCKQSLELNDWIRRLKAQSWIRNVSLQTYNQDKAQDKGEFTLQIDLN